MVTLSTWTGVNGLGVTGGAQIEGGVVAGTSATGSVSGGYFRDGGAGAFASGGAFAGSPAGGVSAVQDPNNANNPGVVVGASVGVGAGGFITNADTVGDLSGPFETVNVNLVVVSFQYRLRAGKEWHRVVRFGYAREGDRAKRQRIPNDYCHNKMNKRWGVVSADSLAVGVLTPLC